MVYTEIHFPVQTQKYLGKPRYFCKWKESEKKNYFFFLAAFLATFFFAAFLATFFFAAFFFAAIRVYKIYFFNL